MELDSVVKMVAPPREGNMEAAQAVPPVQDEAAVEGEAMEEEGEAEASSQAPREGKVEVQKEEQAEGGETLHMERQMGAEAALVLVSTQVVMELDWMRHFANSAVGMAEGDQSVLQRSRTRALERRSILALVVAEGGAMQTGVGLEEQAEEEVVGHFVLLAWNRS